MLKDPSGPSNPLADEYNVLQAKPILKTKRKGKTLANVSAEGKKSSPSDESVVPLENAIPDRRVRLYGPLKFSRTDALVVCVPDPRKRTHDRDDDREVRKHSHNQDRVVIVGVVDKDYDHPEYQPHEARDRASRVDSPKML